MVSSYFKIETPNMWEDIRTHTHSLSKTMRKKKRRKTIKLIVSIITYHCLIVRVIFSPLITNRHPGTPGESGKQMETLKESQLGNER